MIWRVGLLLALLGTAANAQSTARDAGNCVAGTSVVVACWNPDAGSHMNESLADYPEFLPDLHGWDFRINLPHVRFQRLRNGTGSAVAMAGVIEDPGPLYKPHDSSPQFPPRPFVPEFVDYGHRNNTIWLFRVDRLTGKIFFELLPSRVDRTTGQVQNARTLTHAWHAVGGASPARFDDKRLAVAEVGRGVGATTIHLVALASGRLYHTERAIDEPDISDWTSAWQPLNIATPVSPSLVATGEKGLALAWVDRLGTVKLRQLNTETGIWSPDVIVATHANIFSPKLLWDGVTLDVFYTSGAALRHAYRTSASPPAFSAPTSVSIVPVHDGQFDAVVFNNGLHLVVRSETPASPGSAVFYMNTTSALGSPATWTIPSDTGLHADGAPHIATLYEDIFVIARDTNGRLTYARKDPNRVDNRITGAAFADHWLSSGTDIDPGSAGAFGQIEVLSFNSDVYLTAQRTASPALTSAVIVNFSRAAMKQLFTGHWGMTLLHAEEAGGFDPEINFGGPNEARMIADVNGDARPDLVRFSQKFEAAVGPAPVYVRLDGSNIPNGPEYAHEIVWYTNFAKQGEKPLVGNFDGDPSGRDDIIDFVQHPVFNDHDGTLVGQAPVWVALSNGSSFSAASVWQAYFSPAGEIPLVGDFNGDGKDDIITFTQHRQRKPDGTLIGVAPVWVALSTGSSFGPATVWQPAFSLVGETPLVGDFNGDGKADIATFVQKPQFKPDGSLLGHAPVWVALSDGTKFGPATVWHTYFAAQGELPFVADINMDGKADIVTFLRGHGQGLQANNAYVAFSTGSRFERSVTWASDQVRPAQTPFVASFTGRTLGSITKRQADGKRPIPDLFVFDDATGSLRLAAAMGKIPYAVGAPWERYRFFTEKGIGATELPEWIYDDGPHHCLASPFRFILNGLGGVGGPDAMISSVRPGGGAGHIQEEMGHSIYAHCLRANSDPFHIFNLIYNTPMDQGGLDASHMPGCDTSFDDCRDPEHFFIQLARRYRIAGDLFRDQIWNGQTAEIRHRRQLQYDFIRNHWYNGAEFKLGAQNDVSLYQEGVLCLPGECGPPVVAHP